MHPEVTSDTAGTVPAVRDEARSASDAALTGTTARPRPRHAHGHDTPDGLEWEDLMPEINAASDAHNMIWKLVDVDTGKENWDIEWAFRVGDRSRSASSTTWTRTTRCTTRSTSTAPAGSWSWPATTPSRPNLAWKDTVLVRSGETVDILLDVTNPGLWMAHCHIAEHNQSGMMFSFVVHEAV